MKLKKLIGIVLATVMVGALVAACGSVGADTTAALDTPTEETSDEADTTDETNTTTPGADGTAEIFFVSDSGSIDDRSFNQGSWEGVAKFGEEKGISHNFIQPPAESNTSQFMDAIKQGVDNGAKIIVVSGFLFEEAVYQAQELYPDVHFILIDGSPNDANGNFHTADNTVGVSFAEQQAGYLAGYAIVMDGQTDLGFMGGMAVPPVVSFGYGFLQGAEYAGQKLGLSDGDITVMYHYTGGFQATPQVQTLAASWYNQGTETIFGCGGAVGNSVMAAAQEIDGKTVIGVDIDQSFQSDTVVTSAMKMLTNAVYALLVDFYDGNFPGGQNVVFDATNDGVGLPMETSRFTDFTLEQYDDIFAQLKGGDIEVKGGIVDGNEITIADLGLSIVQVTEVN